jgi:Uncharacterized protein conserved in bacteria
MLITLDDLRRFAVARSLFKPTTLKRALDRLGFVQADPIRAPARAQDLILRHRVKNYHAGDLERLYPRLGIEEDFFVVYGFLTRPIQALMHPRANAGVPAEGSNAWPAAREKRARLLLEFVRAHGAVHPREVDSYFSHGSQKLLGRFVERDDTFAGSHALPRHAASGTAAGWRAHLRCAAARSRAGRHSRTSCAD